jgi:hypothetical protein
VVVMVMVVMVVVVVMVEVVEVVEVVVVVVPIKREVMRDITQNATERKHHEAIEKSPPRFPGARVGRARPRVDILLLIFLFFLFFFYLFFLLFFLFVCFTRGLFVGYWCSSSRGRADSGGGGSSRRSRSSRGCSDNGGGGRRSGRERNRGHDCRSGCLIV